MPGSGAGEQGTNRLNGLAVAADDPTYITLAELEPEYGCFAARYFRQHHLIGKLDKLPDYEFEKLFHDWSLCRGGVYSASSPGGTRRCIRRVTAALQTTAPRSVPVCQQQRWRRRFVDFF